MYEGQRWSLGDNVEQGAREGAGAFYLTHGALALFGLFRRRRAYGRTQAGAASLLLAIWRPLFIVIMTAGDPGTTVATLTPVAVSGSLALALVPWLLVIKSIEVYDRKTRRPVRMCHHLANLDEIAIRKWAVKRKFSEIRGDLAMDALFVVGYGTGGFLGADLAGLQILQREWHAAGRGRADSSVRWTLVVRGRPLRTTSTSSTAP